MSDLSERKMKILKAIIRNYLETGEPVGSRTISKDTDLNLSSATIRNEMSDLEELGYILQPHTSAGRIPSDKGYRLYVDELMAEKEAEKEAETTALQNIMLERYDKLEHALKQIVKVLAANTNYATLISSPRYNRTKLKFIQLSQVEPNQILAVVVVEGNIVKNKIIEVEEEFTSETLLNFNLLLNSQLNGLSLEQINLGIISSLKEQAGEYSEFIGKVIDAVGEVIGRDENMEIYTSGATNIFQYPELSEGGRAKELISAFEEKQQLAELVSETLADEENHGIQVYIGNETPVSNMKDCSVVTATYQLGEGMQGTIGIIGPKRMDYEKVVDNLKTLMGQMDTIFKKT